jgi:hypothetical protein
MPQMAVEMERVNESIFEVMSMSTIDSTKIEVPTDIKTAGGEEVLAEVADFLEDQIIEQLPEPPTSPIIQAPQPKNKAAPQRQKIALTASCSEISEPTISQTFVSFKDTEVKRVTWSAKPDDLEESVLEYAKGAQENSISVNVLMI